MDDMLAGERIFECNKCDDIFFSKAGIMNHIKAVHDEHKACCPICKKEFSHEANVSKHIKVVHEKVRDQECPR